MLRTFLFPRSGAVSALNVAHGGHRDEYNAPRGGSSPLSATAARAFMTQLGVANNS